VAAFLVGLSAFFLVNQEIAPHPRLSVRSEEARALAECSGGRDIVIAEAWPAAILAAWRKGPVQIALGPPPEGRAGWLLRTRGVCRLAATRCEDRWPPCSLSEETTRPAAPGSSP
jgi:hypothetical protein